MRAGCLYKEQEMMKWQGEGVRERGAVTLDGGPRAVESFRILQGLRLHSLSEQQVNSGHPGFPTLPVMDMTA